MLLFWESANCNRFSILLYVFECNLIFIGNWHNAPIQLRNVPGNCIGRLQLIFLSWKIQRANSIRMRAKSIVECHVIGREKNNDQYLSWEFKLINWIFYHSTSWYKWNTHSSIFKIAKLNRNYPLMLPFDNNISFLSTIFHKIRVSFHTEQK